MEVISAQDWPPYSFYPPHSSPNISGSTCRRPEKQRASTMRKLFIRIIDGDSHRIQTCNLLIRSQMLYSVELANLFFVDKLHGIKTICCPFYGCKVMKLFSYRQIFAAFFTRRFGIHRTYASCTLPFYRFVTRIFFLLFRLGLLHITKNNCNFAPPKATAEIASSAMERWQSGRLRRS